MYVCFQAKIYIFLFTFWTITWHSTKGLYQRSRKGCINDVMTTPVFACARIAAPFTPKEASPAKEGFVLFSCVFGSDLNEVTIFHFWRKRTVFLFGITMFQPPYRDRYTGREKFKMTTACTEKARKKYPLDAAYTYSKERVRQFLFLFVVV